MAPFGDEALAQELCRAASGGAGLDVVRPLALELVAGLVPARVAVWADADVARGGPTTRVVRPRSDGAVLPVGGFDPLRHRPAHGTASRVEVEEGSAVVLALPAPPGWQAGIGLWREVAFRADECERLAAVGPLVGCAVLAAWRSPSADGGLLTRRETAVLRSVATGLSDKQAARALGVSPRTVGKHLEHIDAKLGVAGRTEAAATLRR